MPAWSVYADFSAYHVIFGLEVAIVNDRNHIISTIPLREGKRSIRWGEKGRGRENSINEGSPPNASMKALSAPSTKV